MLQRSVDAPGRPFPQLPVVADPAPVRSFVTAPPPPTARPALPVVPVGDGVVQRAVGSMPERSTSTSAGSSTVDGAAHVTTSGDAAGPVSDSATSPAGVESPLRSSRRVPPRPRRRACRTPRSVRRSWPTRRCSRFPARSPPWSTTCPTTWRRPSAGSPRGPSRQDGPVAPRRLGLGAPLPAQPGPVVQRSPEAGPRRLGLGAPLTRPPQPRVPDPPDAGPVVQMLPAGGPDTRPAAIGPSTGDLASGSPGPAARGAPGRPDDVDRHAAVARRAHPGPRAGDAARRARASARRRPPRRIVRVRRARLVVGGRPGAQRAAARRPPDRDRAAGCRRSTGAEVGGGRGGPDPLGGARGRPRRRTRTPAGSRCRR